MPTPPHVWESVADETFDWMDRLPDQLAADVIGDRRPWDPGGSHDEQIQFHLEHLYPGGQFDPSYLAHVLTTGTKDEVQALGRALDRYVEQKAEGSSTEPSTPPYPHLNNPARLIPPKGGRRY
jgi:hypothetical protein